MEAFINMILLTLMAIVTLAIMRMKDLFGVVILAGIYSFLMASVFVVLDAVDVAMTEAAVGAGMSTVLFLSALYLTSARSAGPLHSGGVALTLALVTAGVLIYATLGLPEFGTADAPIHKHVADRYLAKSIEETTVPNVVTSILASYRGMDTLGEVAVVFTAGIGVFMLLTGMRRPGARTADDEGEALPDDVKAEATRGIPRLFTDDLKPRAEGGAAATKRRPQHARGKGHRK
ncbi:MAG: DUF4040 domain-containing protein [Rhizobiales bacterium]|nr:DUF4040 domain-containing protein [Hyphomicrobiales bacterium]